jgi:DNA-directed RNA polymerase specialized sigma24 family protein
MQEKTDIDLIARCIQGEHAAFTELVSRHYGSLLALIRRLTCNADQAD